MAVGKEAKLDPEESESEPSTPAMEVFECVVRFEAETRVGRDAERTQYNTKDIRQDQDNVVFPERTSLDVCFGDVGC